MTDALTDSAATDARIRAFYLSLPGRNHVGWREVVKTDPIKYNRVWRAMLGLPAGEEPPEKQVKITR